MPSQCFRVNYLGARAVAGGIWQQAFPLWGCSQRAGAASQLEHLEHLLSHSSQNGDNPTQQLQGKGASLPLILLTKTLTSLGGGERQTAAKLRWGKVSWLDQLVTGTGRKLSLFMGPKNLTQKTCYGLVKARFLELTWKYFVLDRFIYGKGQPFSFKTNKREINMHISSKNKNFY